MPTDPKSRPTRSSGPQQPAPPPRLDTGPPPEATGPTLDAAPLQLTAGAQPVPGYRLERPLGKGGFGEVWQALGPGGFPVAMKFIRLAGKVSVAEQRALELMKQLRHPNLLALHGTWEYGDWLILAMELADGTLLDRLRQAVKAQRLPGIPLPELLRQMHAAAEGLDHLNAQGVQHRDVKPANLLLVGGGVKVGDFGLAKLLQETVATASGSMTPAYASPEVCNDKVSRWSDQYSLAVTYCHLRGNQLPFEGPLAAVVAGHMLGKPNLEMIPAAEREAVARALEKKPQERWPSCTAFVAALAESVAPALSGGQTARGARLVTAGLALLALVLFVLLLGQFGQRDAATQPLPSNPQAQANGLVDKGRPKEEGILPADKGAKGDAAPKGKDLAPKPGPDDKKPPDKPNPAVKDPEPVKPAALAKEIENTLGMKLVLIPRGKFTMGSPQGEEGRFDGEDEHEVEITRPFYLGKYEVTKGEFAEFVRLKGYQTEAEKDGQGGYGLDAAGNWNQKPEYTWRSTGWEQTDRHPVVNVSWNDAVAFCEWLSEKEGKKYRLPTEAEWEYSCRAGTTTRFHSGDDPESLATVANVADASAKRKFPNWTWTINADDGYVFTAPVGKFTANAFGLHDMHGNAWEWCQDWYEKYDKNDSRDPKGPGAGASRVMRGGSFNFEPRYCRAAYRSGYAPSNRSGYLGFRVVCVP